MSTPDTLARRRRRLAIAGHAAIFALAIGVLAVVHATASPRAADDTLPATDTAANVPQAPASLQVGPAVAPAAAGPTVHIAEPLIGGRATWYAAHGMIAAAGPALRGYLGPHWRGTLASVCSPATGQCVVVRISDWCLCTGHGGRLIDLSDDAFAQLAPLSKGIIGVEITRTILPRLPATDTDSSVRN